MCCHRSLVKIKCIGKIIILEKFRRAKDPLKCTDKRRRQIIPKLTIEMKGKIAVYRK